MPINEDIRKRLTPFISNLIMIDCTLKSTTTEIESRLSTIKIQGRDKEFGLLLKDTYNKGTDWEFLPHQDSKNNTRLAIREAGRLTYFSDFGDGLRFGLGILGIAMVLKNTAIFIEEIEPSTLRFIKEVVEASCGDCEKK